MRLPPRELCVLSETDLAPDAAGLRVNRRVLYADLPGRDSV